MKGQVGIKSLFRVFFAIDNSNVYIADLFVKLTGKQGVLKACATSSLIGTYYMLTLRQLRASGMRQYLEMIWMLLIVTQFR